MSENGPSSGSAAPAAAPARDPTKKKKRRSAFGSSRRAARNLRKSGDKFEDRTGKSVAEASAANNTRRAIERGSLNVVERVLEETKEELVKSKKIAVESQASCNMAMEFAREKDDELKRERARRQQAEQEKHEATREQEAAAASRRQAEERVRDMSKELAGLKDSVKSLRKTNATLLEDAGIPIVADDPPPEEDSTRSLEDELLLEKVKAERLQRKVDYLTPIVAGLKRQVSNEKKKTKRAKLNLGNLKADEPVGGAEQEEPEQEREKGGGELLSAEDEKKVLERVIKNRLKPGGKFGETAARLFQSFVQGGVSLNMTQQLLQSTMYHTTGVRLKQDLNITCARNTVKVLALGITQLDGNELVKAILKAPFLLIAGDESLRNGDKKFPIFVAFYDVEADAPWFGLVRVCSMKDKTAETQAQLFYETIVDTLGYPKHQRERTKGNANGVQGGGKGKGKGKGKQRHRRLLLHLPGRVVATGRRHGKSRRQMGGAARRKRAGVRAEAFHWC
ncbi:expressed unknown protein [Ectocarpus siliculosus]|uniref:Uncharacterized protein n=1 Tax=Ectocarpus siliculosus TaxID=2880 RepID=D7FHK1_ECTSI|nr:expressed unknown protein [Ectocarpus siliculosus]|eukprot:CBJ34137.1 expressed unknown protein [Ectocarpus siliculosus]